jgi:hypothetical protein
MTSTLNTRVARLVAVPAISAGVMAATTFGMSSIATASADVSKSSPIQTTDTVAPAFQLNAQDQTVIAPAANAVPAFGVPRQ